MGSLSKKILISLSVMLLTASCVIGGLFVSGNFDSFVGAFGSEPETETTEEAQTEPIEKATRPETLRGTRIYVKTDIGGGQDSAEKLVDDIAKTGFNCLLIAKNSSDCSFGAGDFEAFSDVIKHLLTYARSKGLYTVIDIKAPVAGGVLDVEAVKSIAVKASPDALLLSGIYGEGGLDGACFSKAAGRFAELKTYLTEKTSAGELILRCPFGAIDSDDDNVFFKTLSALLDADAVDTVFTEPPAEASENKDSMIKSVSDWFKYTGTSEGRLIVSQSSSLIKKTDGFEKIETVMSHMSAVYKADDYKTISTVTCAFSDFGNDEECLKIISGCVADNVLPDNFLKTFRISNYNKTSITTDESKISFTGECNPLYPLRCNSKEVNVTEDGDFSTELSLNIGKNIIVFEHRGEKYQYTVTYAIDIIKSISPSGTLKTPGGSALEIRVNAHRNASVYATINGTTVKMTNSGVLFSDNEDETMNTNSDYVTFTGKYNLPAGKSKNVSLGSIKAYASYSGISDSITGASVIVTADQTISNLPVITYTPPPTTTAKPTTTTTTKPVSTEPLTDENGSEIETSEKDTTEMTETTETTAKPTTTEMQNLPPLYTPYKYNGISGTYRMCVVKTDYAETMPLSPLNDLSVPLTTPLLAGTFDFITGESSFDTYTYYNLGSGRRIYRKDVTVIENAYALPANSMTVVGSGTSSAQTYMNLHMTWKVPFNAVLNGQKYINDPKNKREYAVTSLGATSLDITFYYTVSLNGAIDVSGSNVIKSYEWIKNSTGQTCTLRLYLKSASRFYGYSVKYDSNDTLRVAIKEGKGSSVSGHTIMLDPGHGGSDIGASCAANSGTFNEAKINLQLAERIKAKLLELGATVLMTRTSNTSVTLEQRKLMARKNNPDLFISIHCDASSSSSAYGTTAFYYRPYSYLPAKNIHSNLVSTYKNTIYQQNMSTIDRGTVFFPYSVTRIEECPSVLIEYGFVSNIPECKILQDPSHQDRLAAATVDGIASYFANS